jgi:hypothetical protein
VKSNLSCLIFPRRVTNETDEQAVSLCCNITLLDVVISRRPTASKIQAGIAIPFPVCLGNIWRCDECR